MADIEEEIAHHLTALDWPPVISVHQGDDAADAKKTLYETQVKAFADWMQAEVQAQIAARQAVTAAATDEQKTVAASERARADARKLDDDASTTAEYANFYAVFQAVQAAYIGAARDSINNAQARAQFVVTAAAAIGTLYTGLLGLVYGISSPGHALPERGIWAGVFVGLAIVLATYYLAYLTRRPSGPPTHPSPEPRQDAIQRVHDFVAWSRDTVLARHFFLQCAVISLGVGVAVLPLAFITISNTGARLLALIGLLLVFGIPALSRSRANA
jgi:hypothetical protein